MNYEDILEKLVAFNTVNNPIEGIIPQKEILIFLQTTIFDPLNFTTEFIERKNYYSLIAYIKRDSPNILFLGHCDTVPEGEGWDTPPFKLTKKGNRAYGRGSADMKGAVSVMVSLANYFKEKSTATIIYVLTTDEETGGNNGARLILPILKEKQLLPSYIINGDANGLQVVTRRRNPFVITMALPKEKRKQKGMQYKEKFYTAIAGDRTMHAAYFNKELDIHCLNLASEFAKQNNYLISKIDGTFVKDNVVPSNIEITCLIPTDDGEEHEYDENLTKLLYSIEQLKELELTSEYSDYGVNLTCNYITERESDYFIQFDLRIMSNDYDEIDVKVKEFFEKKSIKGTITIKGGNGYLNSRENGKLVTEAKEVCDTMNLSPYTIEMGGATDSRWFSGENIDAIEFGPLGANVHGKNEYVELESLKQVETFYIKLVEKLENKKE